jgi:hypothetical protein
VDGNFLPFEGNEERLLKIKTELKSKEKRFANG